MVGSIVKGQRIVVTGRLRIRDWQTGDRAGTTVEIDADALGHDLAWGSSVFTRSVASTTASDTDQPSDRPAVLEQGAGADGDPNHESDAEGPADTSADRPLEAALPF
ncbi:hypothetical protein BH10ACT6_BH10ACT6_01290 [soil metagenome]